MGAQADGHLTTHLLLSECEQAWPWQGETVTLERKGLKLGPFLEISPDSRHQIGSPQTSAVLPRVHTYLRADWEMVNKHRHYQTVNYTSSY